MSANCYLNNNNKDMKKKFTKTFDLSQIAEDPMDSYLETLGLWKKRIARDGSCLFRAVAEQIYPCQLYHDKVRAECLQFMLNNRQEYEKYVNMPFDDYLAAMKNPFEYGGQLEICAMSKLYKRDFIVFQQPEQPSNDVTQNGFDEKFYICYSYNNHIDAIFKKKHRDNLALIQSLVYEILYDKVFGSGEQVDVARRLLRKSDTIYPKEFMDMKNTFGQIKIDENGNEILADDDHDEEDDEAFEEVCNDDCHKDQADELENKECYIDENNNSIEIIRNNNDTGSNEDSDEKSNIQKMPLPYKVAKSLDPVIYRNTAFDAWLAKKKENEEALHQKLFSSLQVGQKCWIKLMNSFNNNWVSAIIETIHSDSTTVYIPETNERQCTTFDNMKICTNETPQQQNNLQGVQRFVQPINMQFTKIFANTENKRRTMKKKQLIPIRRSSSFPAFTELPTVEEVSEELQNDEYFHSHYYGHQMNGFNGHFDHNNNFITPFNNEKLLTSPFNNNLLQNNKNLLNQKNRRQKTNNLYNNGFNNKMWTNQNFNSNNNNKNYANKNLLNSNQNNLIGLGMPNTLTHASIAAPSFTPSAYTQQFNNPSIGQHNYPQNAYGIPPPPVPPHNGQPFASPSTFMYSQTCDSTYYFASTGNTIVDQQQNNRRRHLSYDSVFNKQAQPNPSPYQQVPQQSSHILPPPQQQQQQLNSNNNNNNANNNKDLGNTSSKNYLLMPAPNVNTPTMQSYAQSNSSNSGMQRSHSYGGISASAYDTNQQTNNGQPFYIDVYIPHGHPQNGTTMYTPANGQPLLVQSNQTLVMNNTSAPINSNATPLQYNNDNSLSYDLQYQHNNSNIGPIQTNGLIDDSLITSTDANRMQQPNIIWNKNTKIGKNNNFTDMVYAENSPAVNNQQFCYTNCYVVNIDGPINFNATHSLQDDGSDLQMNDINTLRFFYNLGIEYYRLNIANNNPYSQPSYTTSCYNPLVNNPAFTNNSIGSSCVTNSSTTVSSTSNCNKSLGNATNVSKINSNQDISTNNIENNIISSSTGNPQVVTNIQSAKQSQSFNNATR